MLPVSHYQATLRASLDNNLRSTNNNTSIDILVNLTKLQT